MEKFFSVEFLNTQIEKNTQTFLPFWDFIPSLSLSPVCSSLAASSLSNNMNKQKKLWMSYINTLHDTRAHLYTREKEKLDLLKWRINLRNTFEQFAFVFIWNPWTKDAEKDLKPLDDNEWTLLTTSWRLKFNYDEEENWDFLPLPMRRRCAFSEIWKCREWWWFDETKSIEWQTKSIYSNDHIICKTDLFIEFYSILLYCKD